ncbi:hypothetical protein [Bacillus sp. SA1-12]|uniref:hypothetical protein n=1 Tax=Bacillus sp. SA1-12 TaxID=1455638 RepID=UPI0006982E98|nr:hypothetical protein [Bacillus sp. SA1-12]
MKNSKNSLFNLSFWASIALVLLTFAAIVVKYKKNIPPTFGTPKYPLVIMSILRKGFSGSPISTKYDHIIKRMSKIDVLKHYFKYGNIPITGPVCREAVFNVFGINLDKISDEGGGAKRSSYPEEIMQGMRTALKNKSSKHDDWNQTIMSLKKAEVMDLFLQTFQNHTYEDIIRIINLIYGINLPGISSLENAGISLYSKNQWLVKTESDLFVVYTGKGDIDVKVYATGYFLNQTGSTELPHDLITALQSLGFGLNPEKDVLYYENPIGESVSDSFKGQTLQAIRSVIHTLNANN